MSKQDKYTRSARGQQCQVRIPGICNFDTDTTVFAHLNGAGWAMKHSSIHGAYCCSDCHLWLDGVAPGYTRDEQKLYHLEGVIRTQILMIKNGILVL